MERNESYKDLDECCDHPLHDVSGDVIIRDRLTVCGNLRAHKVDPAERGLFLTEESLRESCTVCRKGDWALVGEKSPFKVYRWDNGWYDTETTHEVNIPLNEYLTKEEALQTYVSDAELQEEKTAREQADDSFAQDIADLNNNDVLIAKDIATLKERNNAEIPVYSGVVESATIRPGSFTQYSGVYFIKSEGRFAVKVGNEYFDNWFAYGGYQAQPVYHKDNKAVPNRLYNLIALSGGGLHYFDGTTFKMVNDNAELEETVNTHEGSINNLNNKTSELQTEVDEQTAQILTISTNLINVNELVNAHTAEITTLKSNSIVDLGEVSTSGVAESMFGSKEYLTNSSQIFKYKVTDKDGAICLSIPLSGGRWRQFLFWGRNSFYRTVDKDYNVGTWNSLIVDNLNTSDIYSMLSANQGKVLNNKITALQTKVQDVIVVNEEQYTTITSQGNRITETEHRIDEHTTQLGLLYSDFVLMQQTIEALTTRIEALEKGGGGSSANVENGTLFTNASVADGVMSVNGSVTNEILKL